MKNSRLQLGLDQLLPPAQSTSHLHFRLVIPRRTSQCNAGPYQRLELELPVAGATYRLFWVHIHFACSSSVGSTHKGLHSPKKSAAKTTWLWVCLVGKQGMEASPRDTDSSHLHGGACRACQRPAGNHFCLPMPNPKEPLGQFDLLPCSSLPPKKGRNNPEQPEEASEMLGIDYDARPQLSFYDSCQSKRGATAS